MSAAVISPDDCYRYALWRTWDTALPILCIVGLNPSTADATVDDPTIRRCIGFATRLGYGGMTMVNLFALRSTSPLRLATHPDPIGPENDTWIRKLVSSASHTLAAWGNRGTLYGRDATVLPMLGRCLTLGLTARNQPRHPLYVRGSVVPVILQKLSIA